MPKGDVLTSVVNTRNQSANKGMEPLNNKKPHLQQVMSSYLFSNVTAFV